MPRLTPAQQRGLTLLARRGAEAHSRVGIRWIVIADGEQIGSVHSETLWLLRDAGYVVLEKPGPAFRDVTQRITEAGRARAAQPLEAGR